MGDLVKRVDELGMKQVAVTDHGNMFGTVDFYKRAKSAGVKPIIGMEAYVTSVVGNVTHKDRIRENFHLVLLAENDTGYDNLRKLSSKAFIDGKYYYPRLDKDLLREHREGIIALTACLGGEVGKACAKDDLDRARDVASTYKDIFGPDNFFLEVQPNGVPIQDKVNSHLAQLAQDLGLRNIATNDCHYVTRKDHEAQNILMAIRQQKAWDDPTLHKHETDAFYIRSGDEMFDLLRGDYSEAFANACEVGARCNVNIELGTYHLPTFPFPKTYSDEPDYLRHLTTEGLKSRFKEIHARGERFDVDQYMARLNTELDTIISMGFAGYFLIVQDFINWAKEHTIRVGPGRGSGAGSLVAYALRITDLDPIPYNLLFERFLNPERVSMPDFDVDFMQERRGEVINYVAERYGRERVGQIATYAALNPKSAIKDVARTLGVGFSEINELTKPMPLLLDGKKPDLDTALTFAPKLKALSEENERYKRIINVARTLEGLYRQAGMHAGGIVIGEKPLVDYVPLFSGKEGELITQFDKDKVEDAGLVKFDFLGLKTLDVISFAQKLVNERVARENESYANGSLNENEFAKIQEKHPHHEVEDAINPERMDSTPRAPSLGATSLLDVDLLRPDHPKVYKLIASGDTLGVFQVESQGFREMCQKLKPDCFEDIIAAVALYRPGPMQAGMVDDFIDRKHGRQKVVYPHELLEEILAPTYGTFVYQEQIMQSAQILAGYTLGGADILRRAMGKKKFDVMQQQKKVFCDGAAAKGIAKEVASGIFDTIEKFAGYGFNKSHSAAYALITYQTAYLKCFYPVEFMAALLSTEAGSTDNVVKYIHEARTHGIEVLPPDVNISKRRFTVDYRVSPELQARRKFRDTRYGMVRFGLDAIKGLGDSVLESITSERDEAGDFSSLFDLAKRMASHRLNKKGFEALIKSGCLDGFGQTRSVLFMTMPKALELGQRAKKEAESGQTSLFGALAAASPDAMEQEIYADAPPWSERDLLGFERDILGFYLSGHPLDRYSDEVKRLGVTRTQALVEQRHNAEVSVAGMVVGLRERMLKSGKGRWAVVTLEDTFGRAEVLCFSKSYEEGEEVLRAGIPVVIHGNALIDDINEEGQQATPKMRARSVESLAEAQIRRTRMVSLDIVVEGSQSKTKTSNSNPAQENVGATGKQPLWMHAHDGVSKTNAFTIAELKKVALAHTGDVPMRLTLLMPGGYRTQLRLPNELAVYPSDELIIALERIKGVQNVCRI